MTRRRLVGQDNVTEHSLETCHGKGTVVAAGGVDKVTIEGKDFADALFSVWLGQHPVDGGLKDEMLHNR